MERGRSPLYSSLSGGDTNVSTDKANNDNDDNDGDIGEIRYNEDIKDKEEGLYSRGGGLPNRRLGSASSTEDKDSNSSFSLGGPKR